MSRTLEMEGGGILRLWEDGGRVFFCAQRELNRDGLYKVWLRGDGGEMLLGTMAPEGGLLTLRRTLSPMQLQQCGCRPVRGARCRMVYSFGGEQSDGWRWEEHPEHLVDAETARVGEWCRMLYFKCIDGIYLAWPVRRDCPVPLTALICLASVEKIRGETCLVWAFDREGVPRFVPSGNSPWESRSR